MPNFSCIALFKHGVYETVALFKEMGCFLFTDLTFSDLEIALGD